MTAHHPHGDQARPGRGQNDAHALHHHGHAHTRTIASLNVVFATAVTLNLIFVVVEGASGFITHSLALLADAGHNLGDVFSLVLAWMASWFARRGPTARRTYGFGRGTILASLVNAIVLLIAVGAIGLEAVQRLADPAPINGYAMAIVAAVGIVVNGSTALMLLSGSRRDINLRAAFLHMAADTAVSVGVVAAGCLLAWTGWLWLDPAVSLIVALVIAFSTLALLKESLNLAMDAVPRAIDHDQVRSFLLSHAGVASVHDLHIWPLSTTSIALTVHLVMPVAAVDDDFLLRLSDGLQHRYGIDHATIQVERGDGAAPCRLAPEEVI
jgi:cobalt-zinc-cadmium efflux system protein